MTLWHLFETKVAPTDATIHYIKGYTASFSHGYCGTLLGSDSFHTNEPELVTCVRCQAKQAKAAA